MRLELQAPLIEARVKSDLTNPGGALLVLLLDGGKGLNVSVAVECRDMAAAERRGSMVKPGQALQVQCDGFQAIVSRGKNVLRPMGKVRVTFPSVFLFG